MWFMSDQVRKERGNDELCTVYSATSSVNMDSRYNELLVNKVDLGRSSMVSSSLDSCL